MTNISAFFRAAAVEYRAEMERQEKELRQNLSDSVHNLEEIEAEARDDQPRPLKHYSIIGTPLEDLQKGSTKEMPGDRLIQNEQRRLASQSSQTQGEARHAHSRGEEASARAASIHLNNEIMSIGRQLLALGQARSGNAAVDAGLQQAISGRDQLYILAEHARGNPVRGEALDFLVATGTIEGIGVENLAWAQ